MRLKTALWVQACVFRAGREGIAVTVAHKGDPESGALLVKLNRRDLGCAVLSETRDHKGETAWFRGTGTDLVTEADADAYIARHCRRDPDLWVVEIDDRQGRQPFEGRILDA